MPSRNCCTSILSRSVHLVLVDLLVDELDPVAVGPLELRGDVGDGTACEGRRAGTIGPVKAS
jgi:hypothetical protein